MGFYSFYRIIKDIVKSLFGSKGWKILLISIIILIIFINTVYGSSSYPDPYTFLDEGIEYIIVKNNSTNEYIMLYYDTPEINKEPYYFIEDTDNGGFNVYFSNNENWHRFYEAGVSSDGLSWEYRGYKGGTDWEAYSFDSNYAIVYSNATIYDYSDKDLVYRPADTDVIYPYIANTAEDLATGDFDYFLIFPGTLEDNSSVGLEIYKVCYDTYDFDGDGTEEEYDYYELLYEKVLNGSGFEKNIYDEIWFEVPLSEFSFAFENDITYVVQLVNDIDGNEIITPDTFIVYDKIQFTVGGLTAEDIAENRHNALINSTKDVEDAVESVENTIQESSDKFFSDEYDESQIEIPTDASDSVDSSNITNFVTTLLKNIQNLATGDWSSVETISIPLGFVDENIEFRSDLISAHIPTALKYLINVFWMYLFGMYIFKYSSRLIDWLKSGDILNNKEMSANEVITSSML